MKKKILLTVLLAGALLTGCNKVEDDNAIIYTKNVVVALTTSNEAVFEDEMGYLWKAENIKQYKEGDICSLTMSDNGTPDDIFDDIILQ